MLYPSMTNMENNVIFRSIKSFSFSECKILCLTPSSMLTLVPLNRKSRIVCFFVYYKFSYLHFHSIVILFHTDSTNTMLFVILLLLVSEISSWRQQKISFKEKMTNIIWITPRGLYRMLWRRNYFLTDTFEVCWWKIEQHLVYIHWL